MADARQVLFVQGGGENTFHGLADDEVPRGHADLYARAIPRAVVHRLPGLDHKLGNDLSAIAEVLRVPS